MTTLEYKSRFSGRTLWAERAGEVLDVQAAARAAPPAPRGPRPEQSLSNLRLRENEALRAARRAARLTQGFCADAEARGAPFRSFRALDTLEPWSAPAPAVCPALGRLARELARRGTDGPPAHRFTCQPAECPSALRLAEAQVRGPDEQEQEDAHAAKMARVEQLLKTHFVSVSSKEARHAAAVATAAAAARRTPPSRRRRRRQPQREREQQDEEGTGRFCGMFPTEASRAAEAAAAAAAAAAAVQAEAEAAVAAEAARERAMLARGPRPGRVIDTIVQSRFVQAARRGDLDSMKAVYRKYKLAASQFDIDAVGPSGETALMAACHNAHLAIVEYLLVMRASPLVLGRDGTSAECALLDGNASVASHPNHRRIPRVLALLKSSSLFTAALEGDTERVRLCLDSGVLLGGVDAVNAYGLSALHLAFMGRHLDTVLLLLDRGADQQLRNGVGQAPRDCAGCPAFLDRLDMVLEERARAERLKQWRPSRFDHDDFNDI
jgi:hypothetical protein